MEVLRFVFLTTILILRTTLLRLLMVVCFLMILGKVEILPTVNIIKVLIIPIFNLTTQKLKFIKDIQTTSVKIFGQPSIKKGISSLCLMKEMMSIIYIHF